MRLIVAMLAGLLSTSAALAASQPYTYSANWLEAYGLFNVDGSAPTQAQHDTGLALAMQFQNTGVSGSFLYDSLARQTNAPGSVPAIYGGHTLPDGTPYSSFNTLHGTVTGAGTALEFNDLRGFTTVSNDTFLISCLSCDPPTLQFVDSFQFHAEANFGPNIRNLTGFTRTVNGADYRLFNVRMLWTETVLAPDAIPEFLDGTSLLAQPPAFNGQMELVFVGAADEFGTGTQYRVLYDGLNVVAAIPEPQTYALLLAGLGLLGFAARRRSA